ncbi:MAG: class III signal peptide-containing protein [Methanobrevibacter sp.]|nr:class III signal peptide-containing protein [Methanobrevibacter sp.]
MMDDSGQTSAEFILLFGGIMVVVLLAVYMYNNYLSGLGGQIDSKEVNEFNGELRDLGQYFNK